MTFFSYLLDFLAMPIVLLTIMVGLDWFRRRKTPQVLRTYPAFLMVLLLALGMLVYGSLWTYCLIYTRVLAYNLSLVIPEYLWGPMPIEAPAFFGLVAMFCGLWVFFIAKRVPLPIRPPPLDEQLRWYASIPVGLVWLAALIAIVIGLENWGYLALQLVWALPILLLELMFGADILWRYRTLVVVGVIGPTLYLWLAESIAISSGVWTIAPDKSLQVLLAGVLPVEDMVFCFFLSSICIFGLLLLVAEENQSRLPKFLRTNQSS